MASWWDEFWGGVADTSGISAAGGAINSVSQTVDFAKVVWLNVSDYRMWRSLGWLLLGITLMIIGFVVWNRKAIGGAVRTATAGAAVL